MIINLHNRERNLTGFNLRFALAQNKIHNVLSESGHLWDSSRNPQVRTCSLCLRQECCPPNWTPIPSDTFSREDVEALILFNLGRA